MNPIATVVSVQGVVWAQAQDGSVRQLSAGDQVLASEVLISTAGSQIVLDFGDGAPVTLTGEQVMQMADSIRANVSVDPDESQLSAETVEILERLLGPLPEGSTFVRTDGTEGEIEGQGFGFVELGRIGEALEADGINPLRLLRIEEPYRDASIAPVAVAPTSSHGTGNLEDGTLYAQGNNHTGYPGSLTPPPAALPPSGVITVNVPDIDASNQSNVLVTGTVENILPGTIVDITITDKNGNKIELTTTVDENGNYNVPGIDVGELVDGPIEVVAKTEDVGDKEITAKDNTTLDIVPGAITVDIPNVDENNVTAVKVTGTTKDVPPGSSVTLRISDEDGTTLTRTVTVDEDGNYELTVDLSRLTDGQITVDASSRFHHQIEPVFVRPIAARQASVKFHPLPNPEWARNRRRLLASQPWTAAPYRKGTQSRL